jgi:hypothetical protein
MCVYARQGREVLLQEVVGLYDEVLLLVAVDMEVGDFQVTVDWRGERLVHGKNLEGVGDGNGVEYGLKVVITVRSALYDVEPEIDFADRLSNHIL